MTYIVALTGGIGSGKSTVADEFATLGATIVDADIIARQVVEPGKPALDAIRLRFGDAMLNTDGSLNRATLRQRIFSSPEEKQWLNNLLHPLIHQETQARFQAASAPYILWVVPLLVENGLQQRAQRILVVDVDKEHSLRARWPAMASVGNKQKTYWQHRLPENSAWLMPMILLITVAAQTSWLHRLRNYTASTWSSPPPQPTG